MASLMERPTFRLGAFAVGLMAVFGAAFGVGRVTGDDAGTTAPTAPASSIHAGHASGGLGR